MLRGMLSAEICKKALRINNSRGNGALIVKLLDSDVESVAEGFLAFLDFGAAMAQIIAPTYLLWKVAGPASFLIIISPIGMCLVLRSRSCVVALCGNLMRCTSFHHYIYRPQEADCTISLQLEQTHTGSSAKDS